MLCWISLSCTRLAQLRPHKFFLKSLHSHPHAPTPIFVGWFGLLTMIQPRSCVQASNASCAFASMGRQVITMATSQIINCKRPLSAPGAGSQVDGSLVPLKQLFLLVNFTISLILKEYPMEYTECTMDYAETAMAMHCSDVDTNREWYYHNTVTLLHHVQVWCMWAYLVEGTLIGLQTEHSLFVSW